MNLWFGSFHFAVYSIHHNRPNELKLYEREKDAITYAKMMVWNSKSTSVYSLDHRTGLTGKEIWTTTSRKPKLKKVKEVFIS